MLCWCCVVCRWEGGTLGLALEPSHQSITRSHFKAPTHHNLHNTHHNSELSVQRKSNTRIKSDTQHKHNTHSLSVIHTHHYSVLFCSVLLCSVSHHTPPWIVGTLLTLSMMNSRSLSFEWTPQGQTLNFPTIFLLPPF